ncbi:response regulator transcription factor, partial [bacterium]|nr:response regulator transcription factor [bacterium]
MLPRELKRVYLVEDHPLMRKGLRMIVEAEHDFCICGEASTAEEAFEKMVQAAPDLAIIDISLPGMSGLDLI